MERVYQVPFDESKAVVVVGGVPGVLGVEGNKVKCFLCPEYPRCSHMLFYKEASESDDVPGPLHLLSNNLKPAREYLRKCLSWIPLKYDLSPIDRYYLRRHPRLVHYMDKEEGGKESVVLVEKCVTCTVCDSTIDTTSTKQHETLQIPLFTKDSIETCIGTNRSCVFPTQN